MVIRQAGGDLGDNANGARNHSADPAPLVPIVPDWPAPAAVRAVSTTRPGGVSDGRFAGLNLGYHVDDDDRAVSRNRARLAAALALPAEPVWLRQVHGRTVVAADDRTRTGAALGAGAERSGSAPPEADASFSRRPGAVCAVMTADCLPVLLCDRDGRCVAAAHAGWRGLARGVLPATVAALAGTAPAARLLAWLGPAIGPAAFEVGDEVREEFLALAGGNERHFAPSPAGRWLADLYGLARGQLRALGVERVYGGGWCTYSDPRRFYSYRRDGSSGRMATLIWLSGADRPD